MAEERVRLAIALGLLLLLIGAAAAHAAAAASPIVPFSSSTYLINAFFILINANFADRFVNFTVPIPPNTTWQTSHLVSYSLQPQHFLYHDEANNSLMDFSVFVPSLNVTTISYQVSVQVSSTPGYPLDQSQPANRTNLPNNLRNFTLPTYWWNYTDPAFLIPELLISQYTSENNLFKIANGVRNETLQAVPTFRQTSFRLGATEALTLSHGGAPEDSDVFVGLMRSLSLPATRLWSWLVTDVVQGIVTWSGFVQSAFWAPQRGWTPYDVATSRFVNNPAIGEVSDRIITFYIENNLPGPGVPIPLMLSQDQTFFPGGGSAQKSGVLATSRISIVYIPQNPSAAIQLFTLTTTVGVFGAAIILAIIVLTVGYQRARRRRRRYQERLDEFEKRLRGITRG